MGRKAQAKVNLIQRQGSGDEGPCMLGRLGVRTLFYRPAFLSVSSVKNLFHEIISKC